MNLLNRTDQLRHNWFRLKCDKDQNSFGELYGKKSKEFGFCPNFAPVSLDQCFLGN